MTAFVIGIDGARDGWVAARLNGREVIGARSYPRFGALLIGEAQAQVIAVDIPIGIPTISTFPRSADRPARAFVGHRRSSVFDVPPREALEAPEYELAVTLCQLAGISAPSKQAYALRDKILDVAEYSADPRVFEIHPEASFAAMNGRPLLYAKRTWNGYSERRAALHTVGISVPDNLGRLGKATVDDVLDAIAAAWTAQRIAEGVAQHFPRDAVVGEPRIWY